MPKTPPASPDTPGASREPPADPGAGQAQQIARTVHDLRNALNSLLMNTAVLSARSDDVPESLRPFVAAIASAGTRCSEEVTRLFALVEARRG